MEGRHSKGPTGRWRRSPAARLVALAICFISLALAAGCKSAIGDSCSSSTDCSTNGDRLCDTSQTGGYCTVFNCEPDTCPEGEGVCVSFDDTVCGSRSRGTRFARTFCMKPCSSPNDCRSGYECRPVGDQVIDSDPPSRSICIQPVSIDQTSMLPASPNVCEAGPPDESTELDAGTSEAGSDAADAAELPDGSDANDGAISDATDGAVPGDASEGSVPDASDATEGGSSDASADGVATD